MTAKGLKEKFLNINSYEEYDAIRDEFKNLDDVDPEVSEHFKYLVQKTGVRFGVKEAKEGITLDYFENGK